MPAPIALFTYNRLEHTNATVQALKKNELAAESDLWIFSDGAREENIHRQVADVRNYIRNITGFKTLNIVERETNFGLANNIIEGVTQIVTQYGKVIVLEDDLITSPFFLQFINDGLDAYEHEDKVISIHGYVPAIAGALPETFFLKGADCWGWGTWKRGWNLFERNGEKLLQHLESKGKTEEFDFNDAYPYTQMLRDQISGKNNSWAVRWYASAFLNDRYTLYPGESLVFHNGGDESGMNTGFDKMMDVELIQRRIRVEIKPVKQDPSVYHAYSKVLKKVHRPPLLYRIKRKMRKFLN